MKQNGHKSSQTPQSRNIQCKWNAWLPRDQGAAAIPTYRYDTLFADISEAFIPNYYFYPTEYYQDRKSGAIDAVGKGIPYSHVDLSTLVWVEVIVVSISIGNGEVPIAALYKPPSRTWIDADIIELSRFRHKSNWQAIWMPNIHFWNGAILNPSDEKILDLMQMNWKFQHHNTRSITLL